MTRNLPAAPLLPAAVPGKTSRRRFLGSVGAAGVAASVVGCTKEEPKESAGPAKLTIWTNHDQVTAKEIQGYIDAFKKANEGAQITLLNIGDPAQYYTKLKTAAIGKNLPDIFMSRTFDLSSAVANGWLLPLDDLNQQFPDLIDLTSLGPAAKAQNTIDGKLYAAPIDFSCWVMYLNTSLFQESGVELPPAEWTWDDFFALGERFKASSGNKQTQWGGFFPWAHWLFLGILHSNGGEAFSEDLKSCVIDNPTNAATMQRFADMIKSGAAASSDVLPAGVLPFSTGKIAMEIQGSWVRSYYADTIKRKFEYDLIQLPIGSTGKRDIATAGASWGISVNSQQPDWAYKVITHLCRGAIKTWDDKNAKMDADGTPPKNFAAVGSQFQNDAYDITYPVFWSDYDVAWANRSTRFVAEGAQQVLTAFQGDVNKAAEGYN